MYAKLGFGTGIFKFNSIKLEMGVVNINRTSMDGFTKIPRIVNILTKAKIIAIEYMGTKTTFDTIDKKFIS